MTSFIAQLNLWAGLEAEFAWPALWQSSLLIGLVLLLDLCCRRRIRPAVRYTLWLLVLLKLVLPPSLALPTSAAWWLRTPAAPAAPTASGTFTVTYGTDFQVTRQVPAVSRVVVAPRVALSPAGWLMSSTILVAVALLGWMLARWRQVARMARQGGAAPEWLDRLLEECRATVGIRKPLRLRLTTASVSPVVCGFRRPAILLPDCLVTGLSRAQLRTVLIHELLHLRRGDLWVNGAQALLQVVYWWHPLLWLANARIRRLREEAVDDAVMLALREASADYAPTLLEVARLLLYRPLASLGLIGILESKTALRQRIERLIDSQVSRKTGLTFTSSIGVLAFSVLAVPMGEAPQPKPPAAAVSPAEALAWPDPRFAGYEKIELEPGFFVIDQASLAAVFPELTTGQVPLTVNSNQVNELLAKLRQANARPYSLAEPLRVEKCSGGLWHYRIGGVTNNSANFETKAVGTRTIVTGGTVEFVTDNADFKPMELTFVPWQGSDSITCRAESVMNGDADTFRRLDLTIPHGGAALWASPAETAPGQRQVVLLREGPPTTAAESATVSDAPAQRSSSDKAATLIENGKAAYQAGRLDEAEQAFKAALQADSQNETARFYLNLVAVTRLNRPKQPGIFERAASTNSGNDAAAVARPKSSPDPAELYTRVIQADLDKFFARVGPFLGRPEPVDGQARSQAMRDFLHAIGLDLAPPKTMFWSSSGGLMVRAPLEEIKRLEQAIRALQAGQLANTNMAVGGPVSEVDPVDRSWPLDPLPTTRPGWVLPAPGGPDHAQAEPLNQARLRELISKVPVLGDIPLFSRLLRNEAATNASQPALVNRVYVLDPDLFFPGLARTRGLTNIVGRESRQRALQEYFASLGVNLTTRGELLYNDSNHALMIRATLAELDIAERAVQAFNSPWTQINIRARFVEMARQDTRALGFDWYLGNFLMSGSNHAALSPFGAPSAASGVLTDPQTRVLLRALEQHDGADILSQPSVTTLSGRPVQVQVTQLQTIVKSINPQALTLPGVHRTKAAEAQVFLTETIPLGPVLDVVPEVGEDGQTIRMKITATLNEFLGYDALARQEKVKVYVDGKSRRVVVPHPRLRVTTLETTAAVRDGQTLVMGDPKGTMTTFDAEGKPTTQPAAIEKKLLVFLTATLLDPAGNRIHPETPAGAPPTSNQTREAR